MERVRRTAAAWRKPVITCIAGVALAFAIVPAGASATLPLPVITEFTAGTNSIPGAGGTLTFSATVEYATECKFTANHILAGLPATVPCLGGVLEKEIYFPPNTKKLPIEWKITLVAKGHKSSKAFVYLTQSPKCVPGPGAELKGCNLSSLNLENVNLEGANLEGATLTHSTITNTKFAGANLTNVSSGTLIGIPESLPANWGLRHGYLIGPGANLHGALLHRQNLSYLDMEGADLEQADLSSATLEHANLQRANLNYAELELALANEAQLQGAQMAIGNGCVGAEFKNANFEGAELTGANFENAFLGGANLISVEAAHANMHRAKLVGADLEGAVLTSTNFSEADLESVNLTAAEAGSANLQGAELTSANVEAMDLEAAKLAGVISGGVKNLPASLPAGWKVLAGYLMGPGAHLAGTDFAGFELQNADLVGADMEASDLEYVNFENADLEGVHFNNSSLNGALMEGANLTGVVWGSVVCPDGTQSSSHGLTCEGHTG